MNVEEKNRLDALVTDLIITLKHEGDEKVFILKTFIDIVGDLKRQLLKSNAREIALRAVLKEHEYDLSIAGFKMCGECGAEEGARHELRCVIGKALAQEQPWATWLLERSRLALVKTKDILWSVTLAGHIHFDCWNDLEKRTLRPLLAELENINEAEKRSDSKIFL
jgi:hypothetical protein